MIKVKMKDAEGHGYWWYEDGQFVLALKDKPAVGPQARTIAWLKKGIYALSHPHWNEEKQCWYISRFPLLKTQSYGIEIIYVSETVGGQMYIGFVHPKFLTKRDKQIHPTGSETQIKLLPKDLKRTRELAEQAWKEMQ